MHVLACQCTFIQASTCVCVCVCVCVCARVRVRMCTYIMYFMRLSANVQACAICGRVGVIAWYDTESSIKYLDKTTMRNNIRMEKHYILNHLSLRDVTCGNQE